MQLRPTKLLCFHINLFNQDLNVNFHRKKINLVTLALIHLENNKR